METINTNTPKQIDSLNNLIQINNDRIQGYITASKETDDNELRTLFEELMTTSQECRWELAAEVTKLGGKPVEGTTLSGKLYRVWMDVKNALMSKNRKSILNSCEFGEDVAVKTYETELEGDDLGSLHALVGKQFVKIKAEHDKVRQLKKMENEEMV